MLNGKNWWTHSHNVEFEHKEDYNERLDHAIESVWNDRFHSSIEETGLNYFRDAVRQVIAIVNAYPETSE
jgi:hypothetical protein